MSLSARGNTMVWLTGGALTFALLMILGLLLLVLLLGGSTFWPGPLWQYKLADGKVFLGELVREETFVPEPEYLASLPTAVQAKAKSELEQSHYLGRRLLRTGNYELTNTDFEWVLDAAIEEATRPENAAIIERESWGRFYGLPEKMLVDGQAVSEGSQATWKQLCESLPVARGRFVQRVRLERETLGGISRRTTDARMDVLRAKLSVGADSPAAAAAEARQKRLNEQLAAETQAATDKINELNVENSRYRIQFNTASGQTKLLALEDIVRAVPANQLSWLGKLGVYGSRWWEFLFADPREANSEGGIWPAMFGTVAMTLIMCLIVAPLGVLAALYLREYAKPGPLVTAIRVAVNNLAGVPSIVFGVFGLGFFCYFVGASIDQLLFSAELSEGTSTFGTGGILWSSLTLALLTLPVVIVTTEEAIAAVPKSMREGSLACGASKWQTIRNIVLPRALPGIITGMILAMARGAGEVAPLMLVGARKIAPQLPIDGVFPYLHAQRSFMHLGFHIYDLGFQSRNAEAARPMVFTTTLLLILIVATLNISAIWLRARLRSKYATGHF
jgi:phosphate transport system permease protein